MDANTYYQQKRKKIRNNWCQNAKPINPYHLSKIDQYRLGILLNAANNNYTDIKFSSKDRIFTSKDKLSVVLFDFLKKRILKINDHIHIRAFDTDSSHIINISMLKFDINCDLEKYSCCLNLINNGYVYLTDDDFSKVFEKTATSILITYYLELCSANHRKPEDLIVIESLFVNLLKSKTILEALKTINHIFYRQIDNQGTKKYNSFINAYINSNKDGFSGNNYIYRLSIPQSIEQKYVFYKMFGLGDICVSTHHDELLSLYRKDHK